MLAGGQNGKLRTVSVCHTLQGPTEIREKTDMEKNKALTMLEKKKVC